MARSISEFGVCADDLRLPPRDAIRAARDLGFGVVEIGATSGDVSPAGLGSTGRRDLLRHVGSLGIQLGALGAAPAGRGFADPREGERALDQTLRIIELAADLRTPVVTTRVVVPAADDAAAAGRVREALAAIADRANLTGTTLAVASAGADPAWLAAIIDDLRCPQLQAWLDTGDWLSRGVSPGRAAEQWSGHVGWTHVRDALAGSSDRPGHEVRQGAGTLDLPALAAVLDAAGYAGPLVLARHDSDAPARDLSAALRMWRELA